MHELSITSELAKIVLAYAERNEANRVISVNIRVGQLRDIVEEWMQRFFDYVTMGTIAQGAKLCIEWVPVTFRCECGETFPRNIHDRSQIVCPTCDGAKVVLVAGREFEVKGIQVQ